MSVKNILISIFDLNDDNYVKMPWALFIKTLPIIAEKVPNARIYVLTDTKNCVNVKGIIERENLRVISLSRPILRYPYRGLLSALKTLHRKLNIDVLVALCGWNLHVWNVITNKLGIDNLVLIVLTPIYHANELLKISMETLTSLLKYGGFTDFIYFIKLIFENTAVRLLLNLTKPAKKPTIIVFTESGKRLFQRHGFETRKINLKLKFSIRQNYRLSEQCASSPTIAYFGLPIIPRGYDIVIGLARNSNIYFVMYLREPLLTFTKMKALLKDVGNLKVIFRFFRSADELISEAKKYHLILLPFRFVISDFPLVVLEILCSGRLVVTTRYSHVHVINTPNLVVLDLNQVKNPDLIKRLAEKNIRIVMDSCEIEWEFIANELSKALGLGYAKHDAL